MLANLSVSSVRDVWPGRLIYLSEAELQLFREPPDDDLTFINLEYSGVYQ